MISIRRLFRHPAIPREYQANFTHLYLDIAWFGVLSGSAINFLNIYAARLGATGVQIGLLAAMSAVVTLIFAIPSAHWLEKRPVTKAVFWTSVYYRLGFLLWIPLPWLFDNQGQIWALIGLALFMGIPLTVLSVGFNALFAEAVPSEWRAYVAGIRNAVLSITFILASLGSGYLLDRLPFPIGYQIVFGIGFFGAAMSSFHLYFVKPLPQAASKTDPATPQPVSPPERSSPRRSWRIAIRADIWRTPFRGPLLVMFGFHLAQFLAIPLFPLYFVHILNLSDEQIGIGTSLFYLTVLIGSTQLNRIVRRIGHHKLTGFGAIGLSLYPGLLALSQHVAAYYLVSAVGGFSWSMVGGAYANYLLEKIPASDRPAHLAWYSLILNAAVLIGSLAGPALASNIGLSTALILFAVLRLLSGLVILKWG
ncbi:MAG: MFS transporter [Anaerolineales bacterium]|nr:MFS transporter [Anaerolineales bacterium]